MTGFTPEQRAALEDRFWAKVQPTGFCWLWTAAIDRGGYGAFRAGTRVVKAHRFAYEALVAPIPQGLVPDHLCRTPRCVNPDHLDPVTPRVNYLRGFSPTAITVREDVCRRGHSMADAYIASRSDGSVSRNCRTCTIGRTR